jgi:group I intron endonuclease
MQKNIELGYVYKITSPTNRIYVGSTKCISKRLLQYKNYFTKSQRRLHNSFMKYGFDSHIFEIIWEGPASERLIYEAQLGLELNVLSEKNLNCKLPKGNETVL